MSEIPTTQDHRHELEEAKERASKLEGNTKTKTSLGLAAVIIALLSFLTVLSWSQNSTINDLGDTLARRSPVLVNLECDQEQTRNFRRAQTNQIAADKEYNDYNATLTSEYIKVFQGGGTLSPETLEKLRVLQEHRSRRAQELIDVFTYNDKHPCPALPVDEKKD